jgi:DNA polymerase-3 subunit delta
MRIRAEIDKLITYMGTESKTVSIADVLAICGEAGAQSFDELVYAIAGGKTEVALFTYNKLLAEGIPVVQILRILQMHFRKLHYAKSLVGSGLGIDAAMNKMQPPIFFKNQPPFRAQVERWGEAKLLATLTRLAQTEAQMKKTGTPSETLGAQMVLSLAAAA